MIEHVDVIGFSSLVALIKRRHPEFSTWNLFLLEVLYASICNVLPVSDRRFNQDN